MLFGGACLSSEIIKAVHNLGAQPLSLRSCDKIYLTMIGAYIACTPAHQSGKAKGRLDFEVQKPLKQG